MRLLPLLVLLAACPGEVQPTDAGSPDAAVGEGLSFPDVGGAFADGAAGDGPATPFDGAGDSAGPLDGAPSADHPLAADLPPPKPDSAPPPSCNSFGGYTCQSIPPIITCSAVCVSGGTTLGIACYELTGSCSCVKGTVMVGTCSFSGTGCTACQNAQACCAAKF